LGLCGANVGINNGVIKMKKIGFKKLLLALMLSVLLPTFATADTVANECNTGFECVILGFSYGEGKGVKQDSFKAVALYQKACGLNNGDGCTFLGVSYGEGKGVKQDDFKAVEFSQKACDLNNGSGCALLGAIHQDGRGIKQSNIKALEYYGKACDLKTKAGCEMYALLKQKIRAGK
jgi:TPR repeat protein